MNIFKIALIILFLLLTAAGIIIRPEMHNPVLIEDADFEISEVTPQQAVKNTVKTVKRQQQTTVEQDKPRRQIIKIIRQTPDNTVTKIETPKEKTTAKQVKQVKQAPQTQVKPDLIKRVLENAQEQPKTVEKPAPEVIKEEVKPSHSTNPYMTEQEEIIAWNRWRSSIQNRIMRDSNIDFAPLGTMFSFTFVVDKFGNVSNIKVECSNPNFMTVARNNVKPAISNLQRQPILNFPRGTQRTSTVVTGLFVIGTQERYSTPNDYADYERVVY